MNFGTMPQLDAMPDVELPAFDLSVVTFGQDPYGYDHGNNVAKLALVILSWEFPEVNKAQVNRWSLYTAALFHDFDRKDRDDPEHALRSAKACEDFLRGTEHWANEEMRDLTCKLIARHHHDDDAYDPIMASLRDADALDAARINPGMPTGLRIFKERTSTLLTSWAKNRDNKKRYMEYRGWR